MFTSLRTIFFQLMIRYKYKENENQEGIRMSYFGENLRRAREERNMSQSELALQARLGTKTIENYEANLQEPTTQTILKLSTVLDIPASDLLEKIAVDTVPFGDAEIKNDLTGIAQIKWKVYKLTQPKIWVDADLRYLPYFTDTGRNRVLFNLNPQVSIFSDNFKIGFNFYYNYDSKPRTDAAANDDYGLNLQFTYSLN